jgi:Zn-dependent peptidase ImmA (M78 family)
MSTQRARLKARDLVTRLGLYIDPPVRLSELCHFLNATVYEADSDNLDGALLSYLEEENTKRRIIMVNKDVPYTRKRFTVAHELGHLLLHHTPVNFLRNQGPIYDPAREAEANAFASELLMPIQAMRRLAPLNPNPRSLAAAFAVSNESVYWRLKDLGLIDLLS